MKRFDCLVGHQLRIPKTNMLRAIMSFLFGWFNKFSFVLGPERAILITGCDSGIGFSMAKHLIENMRVTVIAGVLNDRGKGAEILRSISKSNRNLHVVPLDVTNEISLSKALSHVKKILHGATDPEVSSILKKPLKLHALINNAGVLVQADAVLQTPNLIRRQMEVNTIGPVLTSRLFLPLLRQCEGSRIINVVSICTQVTLPTLSLYSASKAALLSISNGMRMELSRYGVSVITFNPGDHPSKTLLCTSRHDEYYSEMAAELQDGSMLPYLEACRRRFTINHYPAISETPSQLENPGLYKKLNKILTCKRPNAHYGNSGILMKIFFGLLSILPTKVGDAIKIASMQLPK